MKEKKKSKKHDLIVRTAQKIFAYFGVRKATIDEIAKTAGIGKGTIYNYFNSKEELFAVVVKREEEELKEQITKNINTADSATDKLILFFTTKIKYLFKLKNFYSIQKDMLDIIYSELEQITYSYYEFEKQTLTDIFKAGIDANIFEITDIDLTVNVIMLTSKSLELYWLRNEQYDSPEKPINEIKNLMNIFFNGILKREK